MKALIYSSLILAVLCVSFAARTTYEGHRVVRVTPESNHAYETIKKFSEFPGFNFWTPMKAIGRPVDIMVGPKTFEPFWKQMKNLNVKIDLLVEDVQELFDNQMKLNEVARLNSKKSLKIDNTYYRTLSEIYAELDNFEANFPSLISTETIGRTFEDREIRLAKVSTGSGKQVIWIDCGIHAREWISTASCVYFLDQLSGADAEVTALLDKYDFYVLVVTNPDGYDYTWTDDRNWRKNRSPSGTCKGTDLNRNFDSDFGGAGTSDSPCADTYHGPSAFSELETQAIRDVVLSLGSRVTAFFTIHSYAQYWMTPYGYTQTLPADYDEMYRVAGIGVTALTAVYGTVYEYGNIANVIYEAAGGSPDWTYDAVGVIHSFALELRDQGRYGFALPPDQIEPTGLETWTGIKAAVNAIV